MTCASIALSALAFGVVLGATALHWLRKRPVRERAAVEPCEFSLFWDGH
jgi:hypothetical protein